MNTTKHFSGYTFRKWAYVYKYEWIMTLSVYWGPLGMPLLLFICSG